MDSKDQSPRNLEGSGLPVVDRPPTEVAIPAFKWSRTTFDKVVKSLIGSRAERRRRKVRSRLR
jgi:hypothetical protein